MLNFNKKFLILFSFIVLTILLSSQNAFSCSCKAKPTLLDSYESSDLVIATKLISVKKIREKEYKTDIHHIISAKMVVEKVYKGNVKIGDELTFAQGGGADCIWTFDEKWIGEKFLFYLGNLTKGHPFFDDEDAKDAQPMYRAVTCGRSNGLEVAKDDISYLENIDKFRGKTRISGTLNSWTRNSPSFAGVEIKIIGKDKTYKTKTDENGFYEVYDLPAGEYLIEPKTSFGWRIDISWLEYSSSYKYSNRNYYGGELENNKQIPIILEDKRHAELDLYFEIDNAIRGKIISPNGKPMKSVRVSAIPVNSIKIDSWADVDYTNEKGEFVIDTISPGNYILVVNSYGKLGNNQPFGTLFYPGVSDRKNASVVSIEVGKVLRDIDIQIPQFVELIEVSGKVLFSDGKPFADQYVEFKPTDEDKFDSSRTKTDKQGKFMFKIPKGSAGSISSDEYVYIGEFKNCDKLEKLIRENGRTSKTIKTIIEIDGITNLLNVKLVFPFPFCEKAKD